MLEYRWNAGMCIFLHVPEVSVTHIIISHACSPSKKDNRTVNCYSCMQSGHGSINIHLLCKLHPVRPVRGPSVHLETVRGAG